MKPYTIISFVLLVALSLIPPIEFVLRNPQLPGWLWMVVTAGFFGIFTLFIRTNLFVKVIAIGGFINCFFSAVPYMSFTSYVSLILCVYFYICCTKIEDWKLVFKAAQTILFLNCLLLAMEYIGHDNLMDWGQNYINNFGVLGHHMQMASFATVISAILLSFSKWNIVFAILTAIFCHSSWTFLCAGLGIFVYLFSINKNMAGCFLMAAFLLFAVWDMKNHKIEENLASNAHLGTGGRVLIWEKTLKLAMVHPWSGWGIGTYKEVFFPLTNLHSVPWKTAHNFIAELVFEIGYAFTGFLLIGLGWLWWALYRSRLWLLMAGFVMIFSDALVHFPDRQIQCVPLIIIFLAYCTVCLKELCLLSK